MSRKPTVRHNAARAEMGECYCPRCAPELHAQPRREPEVQLPLPPPPPTAARPESAPARAASGMDPETERLLAEVRIAESQWYHAYAKLHGALDEERGSASSLRARQKELRAWVQGLPRPEAPSQQSDRELVAALTEAYRCAACLVSAMSLSPDWRRRAAGARADLTRALAAVDALEERFPCGTGPLEEP